MKMILIGLLLLIGLCIKLGAEYYKPQRRTGHVNFVALNAAQLQHAILMFNVLPAANIPLNRLPRRYGPGKKRV